MKTTLRILSVTFALLLLALCFVACDKGSASGLAFKTADGVTVTIGTDAEPILAQLGDAVSVNSSESCGGFAGKDYVYTFKGFRVSTTPAEKYQMICKVEVIDDSVKTPEGLYIGMSRTDAEAAMSAFTSESVGGNLVYASGSTKLQVVFRDDCVSGIIYVAA